jgi:hypothetical protein
MLVIAIGQILTSIREYLADAGLIEIEVRYITLGQSNICALDRRHGDMPLCK